MLRQPIRAPSPSPGFPHKSLTATGLTHIVNTSTQEVTMRLLLGLFSALLLAFCASLVANQRPQPNSCQFTIQGTPAQPQISGPPDLVPLVYVVEQPDSPIEIISINLDGSWLSVSGDRYTERTRVRYQVRNRSDRAIQHLALLLAYDGRGGAGASN